MKKWLGIIAGLLLILIGLVVWLDPTHVLLGTLRGEKFYQGRPASYWEHGLLDTSPGKSTNTVQQLAEGGEGSVPVLVAMLQNHRDGQDEHAELRLHAVQILGQIGPKADTAVPELLEMTHHPDREARAQAALALGKIGTRLDAVVPALAKMLGEPADRLAALKGIFKLRDKAKGAIPQIAEVMLKGQDGDVRWHAAEALAKMGAAAQPALPQLIAALKDEDARVRSHAAESLRKIGPEAAEALPALRPLADDADPEVRTEVRRAIKAIEGK
jgi:HEAT repeat protein